MNIAAVKYAKTLYEVTDGKTEGEISSAVSSFIEVLKENGDFKKTNDIIKNFEKIWKERKGIIDARVFSANEMEESEKIRIKDFLKEKFDVGEIKLKNVKDKSVGGGFIIRVEDEVIDASASGKLKRLEKILAS